MPYNLETGQGAFLLLLLTVAKSFLLFNPNLWTPTFSCHQTSRLRRSCFFLVVSIGKIVRNCKLGSAGCGTSWPWVASLQVLLPLFQSDLCLLHLLLIVSVLPIYQQFSCKVHITKYITFFERQVICFSIFHFLPSQGDLKLLVFAGVCLHRSHLSHLK